MMIKKAIITGPTGAVGTALIEELIRHGIAVTAVCRKNSSRISSIPKSSLVSVVECNLNTLGNLTEELSNDYDVFFHFAWDGVYGEDRQDALKQSRNIQYTIDAVHLAKSIGCKVFVGAGSQSEFGHVEGILKSTLPCNPDNGYGIAKLCAGQMSRLECRKLGIRHEWCRIVSIYGPRDGQYTMLMSSILKMLRGERPKFTKGEQIWDYLYNADAAEAFRLIAENGRDGAVYCLGCGKSGKLKDYILAIRDAIDPAMEIGLGELDYYPNQVMHLEADISDVTIDTGWTPKTSFEDGVRMTIEWAKARHHL